MTPYDPEGRNAESGQCSRSRKRSRADGEAGYWAWACSFCSSRRWHTAPRDTTRETRQVAAAAEQCRDFVPQVRVATVRRAMAP